MNVHARITPSSPGRPAEPARRRFTGRDLLAMEEAGILHPEERIELIDGEIIAMPAKSARHEDMRALLAEAFADRAEKGLRVTQETVFRLSESHQPEPDILVFERQTLPSEIRGPNALLVVEVAVTSLSYDLEVKAPIYAAHGVREYWVVDARRLVTHVHRDPGPSGYASAREVSVNEPLVPLLVPGIGVTLASLGLGPLAADETAGPG